MTFRRLVVVALIAQSTLVSAETIGCVTTEWKLIGANHKVCVESFSDPKIPGVTCHVSQARTGGLSGSAWRRILHSFPWLVAEDAGPISLPNKLPKDAVVFSEDTSILFKETRVVRMWDEPTCT